MIGDFRCCTLNARSGWAIGLWAGIALLDLALWSRSLAGAMTVPLPALLAIGSTLIMMSAAIAALILWRCEQRPDSELRIWWPELATMTLPLAWALVAGWGTTPFTLGGLFACWGLLIAAVGLVDVWGAEDAGGELANDRQGEIEVRESESKIDDADQWQKRLVVDGRELIEGEVSVDFAAGQKTAVVHLSFCPPLASVPEIHAEDSLGGDVDIRTEAAHPYGARLSMRRSAGIDAAETRQISYSATNAEPADSAA